MKHSKKGRKNRFKSPKKTPQKGWFSRAAENLIFRVTLALSVWLRKNAEEKFAELSPELGLENRAPEQALALAKPVDWMRDLSEPEAEPDSNVEVFEPKGGDAGNANLPAWAREIQPFLLNQLSAHTRRAYETDLKQFFGFLEGRILPSDLQTLRSEHIILYRKYLEEGRLSGIPLQKATVNRKLAVVKSFLNWLRANHHIRENPAQWVKGFPQSQESTLVGFSDTETRQILDAPRTTTRSGALHGAILHTLFYLGLRKGELLSLRMGDISEDRGVKILRVPGKGHRVRVLPIPKAVEAALDLYFLRCARNTSDPEAPLFTPTKNPRTKRLDKMLNPNAISYIVIRYARKTGVLKRISPHSCRATCISHALDRKATHRSVQHLAGWSTPLMIQRYDKRREDLKNSAAFLINYSVDEASSLG